MSNEVIFFNIFVLLSSQAFYNFIMIMIWIDGWMDHILFGPESVECAMRKSQHKKEYQNLIYWVYYFACLSDSASFYNGWTFMVEKEKENGDEGLKTQKGTWWGTRKTPLNGHVGN